VSTGERHDYRTAYLAMNEVAGALYDACERIALAGSLRRLCDQVGDVELVAIPRFAPEPVDLLGEPAQVNQLEARVAELVRDGVLAAHPTKPANGAKYKKLWLARPGIGVDLFIVTAETWGPAMFVRTGPADFSKAMVIRLRECGYHLEDLVVKQLAGGAAVPCPDEKAFFKLCGRPSLPPEMRS